MTRKGYIFAVVGMPLLFGAIFGISFLTSGTLEQSIKSGSGPIAVVDRSNTLDFELAATVEPARRNHRLRLPKFFRKRKQQAVQALFLIRT